MDKILGLDIGKKRIGISISDGMQMIAHPVETILREPEKIAIEKIKKICEENGVKIIVVKSHSDNGYYIHYNGNTEFCPFYNNNAVISTMGAGDVFNGGFLSAVTNGYTPLEAAQIAAKQAGIYIDRLGQIKDIPTSEELLRL